MRALIWAGALFVGSMIAITARADSELPFETLTLSSAEVPLQQLLDGTVEAINRSTVSAQTSGRVLDILYDVDDFVEKGAVIVRLRDTTQQADFDQATAGLEGAKSRFIEARDEQKRVEELFSKKLIAQSKLDAANAALKTTQADVKASEAQLRQATEQLENTIIKAPYSGIVTQRHVEPGEIASPGTPIMTGISLEKLRVSVSVPQRFIAAVRDAGMATILFDSGDSIEASNLVFFPYADPQTNSFRVRIQLDEAVKGIFPGMYTKVAFNVGTTERLLVPKSAVAYRSELTGIYVVREDGSVSLRQVRLGRDVGDRIEILAGAEPGQTVALDPAAAGIYIKERGHQVVGESS